MDPLDEASILPMAWRVPVMWLQPGVPLAAMVPGPVRRWIEGTDSDPDEDAFPYRDDDVVELKSDDEIRDAD
jgi:hypothetical protein